MRRIITPHHLENQVMDWIVQPLGGALFESVEFATGKALNELPMLPKGSLA
jgi:hypothetical protein